MYRLHAYLPMGMFILLLASCASPMRTKSTLPSTANSVHASKRPQAIVYCADGAGGFGWTTEALADTAASAGQPIHVELVPWSHGWGRMITDNCHWRNIKTQGTKLAESIRQSQTRFPTLPVYLIGHSAGCAVILEAAGQLPPNSLERIILLAPSVSPDYDLRPSLAATSQGIDAFISRKDWVTLGLTMRIFGTTDRRWTAAAGKSGFRQHGDSQTDRQLYARLRQHAWNPDQAAAGHPGGHYGSYEPAFLRSTILPLLMPNNPRGPGQ